MKVSIVTRDGKAYGYSFYCPGCKFSHVFTTKKLEIHDPEWYFNGDVNNPTFNPSLLLNSTRGPEQKKLTCHLFVANGQIQYLNDCTHDLAGQTIEMEDRE